MINQYMGVELSTFQVVYIYETQNLLRFDAWGSTLVMLWDTQLSGFMFLYRVSIICGILKCLLLADSFFFRYFFKTWITSEPLQVSRWWSQKKQTILCKICTDGFILSHCSWFRWKKWPAKNVNVILGYLWDGRICWLRLSEFLTHIFELGMKKSSMASIQECYIGWFVWEGAFPWQKLCENVCVNNVSNELGSWILSTLPPSGKLDQEIGILKWSIFHPTIIHPQTEMDTPDTPRSHSWSRKFSSEASF